MIIQTLPAAPGDVIVVTVPQTLSQTQRDAMEARVVALVADTRVLILDGGAQMTVLKRPAPYDGIVNVTVAGKVETNDIVRHWSNEEIAKAFSVPPELLRGRV